MKKLLIALILIMSLSISAFAVNPTSESTEVTYTGTAEESYTVTVPASLTPNTSGDLVSVDITVAGTWASNRQVSVTAPSKVTLTNSINALDTKDLAIDFDGITQAGSNTGDISSAETLTLDNVTGILFGTWTGTIEFTVSCSDIEEGE